MFNGIIFNQGQIVKIDKRSQGINLFVKNNFRLSKKDIGISISCDGVCLTVISIKKNVLQFYLSNETVERSKFKNMKLKDEINIEMPLKYGQKISGHICQGHVDTVGKLNFVKKIDKSLVFDFLLPRKFKKYLISKASILINGVSLTISKVTKQGFQIWVIPHTLKLTNLKNLKKNDIVNVEIDILSKYIKKFLKRRKTNIQK